MHSLRSVLHTVALHVCLRTPVADARRPTCNASSQTVHPTGYVSMPLPGFIAGVFVRTGGRSAETTLMRAAQVRR